MPGLPAGATFAADLNWYVLNASDDLYAVDPSVPSAVKVADIGAA